MKHFKHHPAWQFIDSTVNRLPDPRVSIAVLSAWTPLKTDNRQNNGVEPDNYNFAVYDDKPHDLKFIENSVFYKSNHQGLTGWFSLYIAEERSQATLFNQAIIKLQPRAVWRYSRAKPIRPVKTILPKERDQRIRTAGLTAEERLWQQGYFTNLQHKYFDGDEKFIRVVGEPRGLVLDLQPEVDDQTDYCDN
jgi:hypothetical protein